MVTQPFQCAHVSPFFALWALHDVEEMVVEAFILVVLVLLLCVVVLLHVIMWWLGYAVNEVRPYCNSSQTYIAVR